MSARVCRYSLLGWCIDSIARTWIGNAIEIVFAILVYGHVSIALVTIIAASVFFLQLASSLLIKDGQFSVHVGVLT